MPWVIFPMKERDFCVPFPLSALAGRSLRSSGMGVMRSGSSRMVSLSKSNSHPGWDPKSFHAAFDCALTGRGFDIPQDVNKKNVEPNSFQPFTADPYS